MSTILGILRLGQNAIGDTWGDGMLQASQLWPHDEVGQVSTLNVFLACQKRFNTPQAVISNQPYAGKGQSEFWLLFDGRIDNRIELAANIDVQLSENTSDETLIYEGYKKYGTKLGKYLIGDFTIAIYDRIHESLFLIRDQLGVRPLYIAETTDYIAFASNKPALLALGFVDNSINPQWVADLLVQAKIDKQSSFYQSIHSFRPAHWRLFGQASSQPVRYWTLESNPEIENSSENELVERFQRLLKLAINSRLRCYGDIASELSGGIDSSSITALSSIMMDEEGKTMTACSHQLSPESQGKVYPFFDESKYASLVVARHKNLNHFISYSSDSGVIDSIKRTVDVHSSPTRNDLSFHGDEVLSFLKKNNMRVLLSGFGGDHLVTSLGGGYLEEFVQRFALIQLWRETSFYRTSPLSRARLWLSIVCKSILPTRILNFVMYQKAWRNLSRKLGAKLGFLKRHGFPKRFLDYTFNLLGGTVREREARAINSPVLMFRLEDSSVGASSYGVDYRYPLLDIRLLEFCLSIPSHHKVSQGVNRRMIRLAMTGILPKEILTRVDKTGSSIPSMRQKMIKDKSDIIAMLEESKSSNEVVNILNIDYLHKHMESLMEKTHISDLKVSNKSMMRFLSLIVALSRLTKN